MKSVALALASLAIGGSYTYTVLPVTLTGASSSSLEPACGCGAWAVADDSGCPTGSVTVGYIWDFATSYDGECAWDTDCYDINSECRVKLEVPFLAGSGYKVGVQGVIACSSGSYNNAVDSGTSQDCGWTDTDSQVVTVCPDDDKDDIQCTITTTFGCILCEIGAGG